MLKTHTASRTSSASSSKVGNAALAVDAYAELTQQIAHLRLCLNGSQILAWVLFSVAVVAVDLFATWHYFQSHWHRHYGWSGVYVVTGLTKLFLKWVVIREKKLVLSHQRQLCNVVEYRISRHLRYYVVYVRRYPCSGFEFINSLFCYTFFSSLLLTYNKTEAVRVTFGKLWWLYLSYFTFEDPPPPVSFLYVVIFAFTNIVYQTRVIMNYFGFPTVEEYALVRSAGFRHAALALGATTFCVGFDAQNRYCLSHAKNYKDLTEPRFFRLEELQISVPTYDFWKVLQATECPRAFHRQQGIAELFKYLSPDKLTVPQQSRPHTAFERLKRMAFKL